MFTGIIEEICVVNNISRRANMARLTLSSKKIIEGINLGDSVAVNGSCLTAVEKLKGSLIFEMMPETLKVTNLKQIRAGDRVNTERALKIGDRVSGHFVTGHIDCAGLIRKKYYSDDNLCFDIAVPLEFMKYLILKGSVAVDGVSLTIMKKRSNIFSIYIIPFTLQNTTFAFKGPSDKVNIEFDILAKRTE